MWLFHYFFKNKIDNVLYKYLIFGIDTLPAYFCEIKFIQMKRIILLTAIVLTTASVAMAQREGKTRFSVGPELGVVTGNASSGWSIGIGGSADVQYFFQENLTGVFSIGYVTYTGKSAGVGVKNKNYTTIPVRVGGRYFIGNNFHLGAQVGVGINRVGGIGNTQFSYSPQIGYNFRSKNDKPFDATLKYDGYAGKGDFSAIGIRLSLIL